MTGTRTASTMAEITRAVALTSRASAAPLPRLTTFGHRAPEVDVDKHGAPLDAHLGRIGHHGGIAPDQLGGDRRDLAGEIEEVERRFGAADHRLGGDHLGGDEPRAELPAQLAAGGVGDPDHRRDQHR